MLQKNEREVITTPTRQENKTPVFQPRNEPKQYRQDVAPSQNRTEPTRQPEQNNNRNQRRK